MPRRVFTWYQRKRIVNLNANIIASGVLSTLLVAGLVWVLEHPLGLGWPGWGYTAFSLVADVLLDVSVFAGLHWVANHWRPLRGGSERERAALEAAAPNYYRDAAQVQGERLAISPLYYLIALALTQGLQMAEFRPYWAIMIGYVSGLLITRTLHTIMGLRSGSFVDHHKRLGVEEGAGGGVVEGEGTEVRGQGDPLRGVGKRD